MKKSKLTALEAAITYVESGWAVVPVAPGEKKPLMAGWQELRLTRDALPTHFSNGNNIGLILGQASGGLVDVDLDAPEAVAAAEKLLPPTAMVHGRPSRPRSHYWYVVIDPPTTKQFKDPDGTSLVELRGEGGQTVVPPSAHPTGEVLQWDHQDEPARINLGILETAVARVAACALVARHWPATGTRHATALALAGFLLRGGWSTKEAERFVETAARAARDEEAGDRKRDVGDTARVLAAGRPTTGGKQLADLLGDKPVSQLAAWLHLPTLDALGEDPVHPYRVQDGRFYEEKMTRNGPRLDLLANFVAEIAEETLRDDGREATRTYTIKGTADTGQTFVPAYVQAARFPSMQWVGESWGSRAVICAGAGAKDALRAAIQWYSSNITQRCIFTHTGWRQVDGQWVYLTATGGVGQEGVEVDLGPHARYALPRTPENVADAMRASLQLLEVGPLTAMAPLWAAVYRAPLAEAWPVDMSLWVEGITGNLKSTLVALFLAHWGDFTRTTLPGAWASTANALEKLAFTLKDTLVVIDDYAPASIDARELEAKAGRILRSQGNLAARARLRADLTDHLSFFPRGLIVATGEQHPSGQSLLARTLFVEWDRAEINLERLSACQRTAGLLPNALAGYVGWLAPQIATLKSQLRHEWEDARTRAIRHASHLRVPEVLAHLWLGLDRGLAFAETLGVLTATEAEERRAACWAALEERGHQQTRLVEGEQPSRRFLEVLAVLVRQGRARLFVRDRNDEVTDVGLIGWRDQTYLYLMPSAAFNLVAKYCRESGEPFPVSRNRLMKDLAREGVSVCDPDRRTTTVKVDDRTKRVLCLRRDAIAKLLEEEFPDPVTEFTGARD